MAKKTIAQVLKERRRELGLSVKEVCASLNSCGIKISPSTLYGYENGNRTPDPDTLFLLCDEYDIDDMMLKLGYASNKDMEKDMEDLNQYAARMETIGDCMLLLNETGQIEAVRRIQELTEISKYITNESPSAFLTNECNEV